MAALCGAETGDFSVRGMTMFLGEYCGGELWTVSRTRASFRAGEVSVKELLGEFGVLKGFSSSVMAVERGQVVL